ncbi:MULTISPECIES: MATE family efflux transporter [unclassified Thioclava]|uniref:MATE family efflux transporter n=1 Tax=unclassified Thioclava TaxID=2621713 RepID=UPI000997F840|nr:MULTISPECIES: MATE family efflux transporter [unclassified Thioclava]MPQ92390.1 MATE family efflux transporter [Thioclava sp. JE_KL1]OOY21609.1 MATE family efflux transporter [Thioclava sp. DLFJ5-1]
MAEITHARVLKIALPIVLSNATIPILGAVDTAVVGQIGLPAPIGAVGIGAVILSSLYWIFGFLRMGTTGLVSQAHGTGDTGEVSAGLMRALIIAGIAGLSLIVLQLPLFWAAFQLAPASDEVERLARDYLQIRIWGAPLTISLYAFTGWLIALERTRGVLLLQVAMNALNVGLDLLFVLGLGWGVQGVAGATLISEISGVVLALWLCRAAFAGGLWRARAIFDRVKLATMARVNTDIMLRSILLQASFTSFLFLGAGQGDVTLAANQVLLQFLQITAFALDGFAFSAESLVGQAVGAHSAARLRRASIVSSQWGIGGALALGAVFLLAGPAIIDLMTTAPNVRIEARDYLIWIAAAPLIGGPAWMLDGIFIGATLTREMRNAMVISVAIYTAALFVLIPLFGNHGLWAGLMILNATRGLTMARLYPRAEAKAAAG